MNKHYLDQFQFLGFFDLMNWPTGPAPELTAWNRWMLGFISDQEIRCISGKTTIESIAPIESDSNSLKSLFIRLSNSELLVIESRASIGFDNKLPDDATGLIVYIVNFDIDFPFSSSVQLYISV